MKVLLVVDVQNDFITGSLAVKGAAGILPAVNTYVDESVRLGFPAVYTRDWHPADHCSFKSNGGPWPAHCVQNTTGADFHPDLKVLGPVFPKGMDRGREEYSAVSRPSADLVRFLEGVGPTDIYVCGIATDYCVKQHVLDLLSMKPACGWDVWVLADAVAAVNVKPEDGHEALLAMKDAGARFNAIKQTAEVK